VVEVAPSNVSSSPCAPAISSSNLSSSPEVSNRGLAQQVEPFPSIHQSGSTTSTRVEIQVRSPSSTFKPSQVT
jgi:hypothetical protein